jgi:DNA helicase II / ATP-dependent DNA helicase PcrA
MGGISWLEAAAKAFSKILVEKGYLSREEQNIFAMSVEEMKTDMRNNKVDIANLTIDDLGTYASPDSALKLASLHHAKGRRDQTPVLCRRYARQTPVILRHG